MTTSKQWVIHWLKFNALSHLGTQARGKGPHFPCVLLDNLLIRIHNLDSSDLQSEKNTKMLTSARKDEK